MALSLPFIGKKKKTFSRAHARHECFMPAGLHIIDSRVTIDGMIFEVSKGGLLFRPALRYILDRNGADVRIDLPGMPIMGIIMSTRENGYGIKLHDMFEEEDVEMLTRDYKEMPFKYNAVA
jgi:hypothetical protein